MRRFITYTLLVAAIYYFPPEKCMAQYENNFWYFGNLAGVDFSSGQPLAILDGKMQSKEGCAVISDKNGNLLFYTNGLNIWNRKHHLMKNGTGLKGDDGASNSSMIIPDPGNSEQYYLFAVDDDNGISGLTYSVINIALDNNLGAVVPNKYGINNDPVISSSGTAHAPEESGDPGIALGDTIWFKMNNKVFIDSVKWDLGVRAKSSSLFTAAKDTFYTYKDSGNYPVNLTIYSMKGTSDNFQEALRVDLLPEINLGKDISACELSPPVLDGGIDDGRTWLWNNGSTERFFTASKTGSYSLRVEKNKCFSFDSLNVKINPMPKITLIDLKHSDCNIENGKISVEVDGEADKHKFVWEGLGINNNFPIIDSLAAGDYPLTVINEYGCSGKIDTLEIRELGVPDIELIIDKTTVCPGEEVSLKVSNADRYEWSTGETDEKIIISEQESKLFWVKGISESGCYKKKDFFINVYDKPAKTFDNSISACEGDTVVLDGGIGDYQFKWENGSNERFLPVINYGKYSVNITDNFGCNYIRSAEILFNTNPLPDLGPDISLLCYGNETTLDVGEWQSYSWSTEEKTPKIIINKAGYYEVTVRDNKNCKGSDQVYVNIPPKLNLDSRIVQPDCVNCNNGTISVNPEGGTPPYSYLWSNFESDYVRAKLLPGIYSVRVTDANNCSEILKTELSSDAENYIEVPNAFTPNGDGINDEWRIKNSYMHPGIKVRVFDNRGVEIFSSTGYASPWNGSYNGSTLPTDTYYYVIDPGNGNNPITGQVTVII